jgi:hypothetical protein
MAAMNRTPHGNGKHDVITHRLVVVSLGLTVLLTGLGITLLPILGKEVPPSLPALGGTALGALTGMLAAIMRQPNGKAGEEPPENAP